MRSPCCRAVLEDVLKRLTEDAAHEDRCVSKADHFVLLPAPRPSLAWKWRSDVSRWLDVARQRALLSLFVASCDPHSAALRTIVTPSSDATEVLDAVLIGEPLHRALIFSRVLELQAALFLRESTLRTDGVPMLRFEGEGAKYAIARSLHIGVAMKVRSVRDALQLR